MNSDENSKILIVKNKHLHWLYVPLICRTHEAQKGGFDYFVWEVRLSWEDQLFGNMLSFLFIVLWICKYKWVKSVQIGTMRWDCKDFFKYLYEGPKCSVGYVHVLIWWSWIFLFRVSYNLLTTFACKDVFTFCLATVGTTFDSSCGKKKKRCEGNNDQTRDNCKVYWPNKSLYTKVGIQVESLLFTE